MVKAHLMVLAAICLLNIHVCLASSDILDDIKEGFKRGLDITKNTAQEVGGQLKIVWDKITESGEGNWDKLGDEISQSIEGACKRIEKTKSEVGENDNNVLRSLVRSLSSIEQALKEVTNNMQRQIVGYSNFYAQNYVDTKQDLLSEHEKAKEQTDKILADDSLTEEARICVQKQKDEIENETKKAFDEVRKCLGDNAVSYEKMYEFVESSVESVAKNIAGIQNGARHCDILLHWNPHNAMSCLKYEEGTKIDRALQNVQQIPKSNQKILEIMSEEVKACVNVVKDLYKIELDKLTEEAAKCRIVPV